MRELVSSFIHRSFGVALVFLLPAAAGSRASDPTAELARVFAGREASFVALDTASGRSWRHDAARAATRFSPCSTFKIPHGLIGLETGVLDGPNATFEFRPDVHRRDPETGDARWARLARDQTLRSAIQDSVVWYFLELYPKIGEERMREWLERLDYGNRDLSAGNGFWISSSLRISADEQVRFLSRLVGGEVASARTLDWLREILTIETGPEHALYAKTGMCTSPAGRRVGWYVGWVERKSGPVVFALNLEADDWDAVRAPRYELARRALETLGVLPPAGPASAG